MELAVDGLVVSVDQFEGVAAVAIHVAKAVRGTTVPKEEGHLVVGLRAQRDEVPEHVHVLRGRGGNKDYKW